MDSQIDWLITILLNIGFWTFLIGLFVRRGFLEPDEVEKHLERFIDQREKASRPAMSAFSVAASFLERTFYYEESERRSHLPLTGMGDFTYVTYTTRYPYLRHFFVLSLLVSTLGMAYMYVEYSGEKQKSIAQLKKIEGVLLATDFLDLKKMSRAKILNATKRGEGKAAIMYKSYDEEVIKTRLRLVQFEIALDRKILESDSPIQLTSARMFGGKYTIPNTEISVFLLVLVVTLICMFIDLAAVSRFTMRHETNGQRIRTILFVIFLFLISADVYASVFSGGGSVGRSIVPFLDSLMSLLLLFFGLSKAISELQDWEKGGEIPNLWGVLWWFCMIGVSGTMSYFLIQEWPFEFEQLSYHIQAYGIQVDNTTSYLPRLMSLTALAPLTMTIAILVLVRLFRIFGWTLERTVLTYWHGTRVLGASNLVALISTILISSTLIVAIHKILESIFG